MADIVQASTALALAAVVTTPRSGSPLDQKESREAVEGSVQGVTELEVEGRGLPGSQGVSTADRFPAFSRELGREGDRGKLAEER